MDAILTLILSIVLMGTAAIFFVAIPAHRKESK